MAVCAVLAGCGRPDLPPAPRAAAAAPAAPRDRPAAPSATDGSGGSGASRGAPAAAPGPRLPDGVAPVAYDLTLELDPERASFTGHVAIAIAVAAPGTTRLWLHAAGLDIARAVVRGDGGEQPVGVVDGGGDSQMRGFILPRPVGPGRIALVIDYTGRVTELDGRTGKTDEEGLFRERTGGRWYLYSQSESVFARRIVPCFDEPRFKPAWRVTAVVPRDAVALGNAAPAADRILPDGRREVRFAEIAALPSYLLAVAVGPFELVDAGRLGRGRIPVRFAVAPGDGGRVADARRELPRIIDALERYIDAPLPLRKLDLVAVPEFFGAMENPGLITIQAGVLAAGREFVEVAAHELAHQWFGDAVTPAWWDQLWLSEAFASWLGERVTASLGASRPPVLAHRARLRALEADDAVDAPALVHPIASSSDVEPAFDAIAYDKGAAVLAMFEQFVDRSFGPLAFRAAVRGYLAAHAGGSVTSRAFFDALGAATRPEVAGALASIVEHAGTPVVELALRCAAAPPAGASAGAAVAASVIASARDGVTVPVCLRYPTGATGTARACFLAGARTEQPLPAAAGCPAWLVGNDGGAGYYRTVWRGSAPLAPLAALSPEERLARGDDAAIAVARGELAAADALAELAALASARDPYGALAGLEIARAIDGFADPARAAWTDWLARRYADRLTSGALLRPGSPADYLARGALVALVGGAIGPDMAAAARAQLGRRRHPAGDPGLLAVAAAGDAGALFDAVARSAAEARGDDARDAALEALGEFPAPFAPRVVDLVLDRRFPADRVWPAVAAMLSRGETRSAAWRAIRGRFAALVTALGGAGARDAIAALAGLCDAGARAELAAVAAPRLAAIERGRRVLDRTLAAIDRCVARRAGFGDLAAALAAGRTRSGL